MATYSLKQLLEKRKKSQLYVPSVKGGHDEEKAAATKEDNNDKIFFAELNKIIKENNRWLTLVFVVIGTLIVFLLVLAWRWQANKEYMTYFLAGEGISISICIERFIHLYKQKRHSELLIFLYRTASSAEDKAKVIDSMLIFLTKEKEK